MCIRDRGKAIEEIIFDHSSVKIYAQQFVLDKLDKVSVQLDATKLTSDTKMYQTITLPTGVRQRSEEHTSELQSQR